MVLRRTSFSELALYKSLATRRRPACAHRDWRSVPCDCDNPESPAACGWANGNPSVPMGSSLSGSESERRTASKIGDNDWLIPCGLPLDAVADCGLPSYPPTSHKHLILSSPEGMPFNETGLS